MMNPTGSDPVPGIHATRFDELKALGHLPSPTGTALAILRLAESDTSTTQQIARVLQTDPALAGRVLKIANSGLAGGARSAFEVQDAVARLGIRQVRNVALGFSLISQNGKGKCPKFDYQKYWSRSLATAVGAQAAAYYTRQIAPGEAFTCGLLASVGQLALASIYPDAYEQVLLQVDDSVANNLSQVERHFFATDHNELTAALLKDWGLPEVCIDAARHHEAPQLSGFPEESRKQKLVRLLNLASQLASICIATEEDRSTVVSTFLAASAEIGIPSHDLTDLCERVVAEWQEWGKILQVDTPVAPGFAELAEMVLMAGSEGEEEAARATAAPDRLRVVVVDDDPIELKLLARHLTTMGHEVHTAVNGRQALECVLSLSPQLIITDWRMPEMDGMALCRALRQTKMGRQLYVLMLTGSEEDDSQIEAFDAGADDYIVKPFRPKILAARVRACARVYRLQQEIQREQAELQRCMSDLGVANRKLQQAALTDPLTGLYNRRYAMERLNQEWAATTRSGHPLSCLVIDIDFFKRVNDTYGHDVGDLVLRETAATLRASLRQSDVICRIGGEEFVVFGPIMDLQTATACAERLRALVQATTIEAPRTTIRVTLSIGVAERSAPMASPADLLKAADQAVYVAKQEGRNRVCVAATPQPCEPVLISS